MSEQYIFIAKGSPESGIFGRDVISARLTEGYWPLNRGTPYRTQLSTGDSVLFYVAGADDRDQCLILARAVIGGEVEELRRIRPTSREWLGSQFPTLLRVPIISPCWFVQPIAVRPLAPKLSFVRDPQYWGRYFQGGVKKITEADLKLLTKRTGSCCEIEKRGDEGIEIGYMSGD